MNKNSNKIPNKKSKPDLNKIYSLFFQKKLVDLVRLEIGAEQLKTPKKRSAAAEPELTPISKKIYDIATPRSKPIVLQQLALNDAVIKGYENKENTDDPDYQEKLENNGLGFFMENIVSVYGRCPVCGESMLKKYAESNIPIVDLVCVNDKFHLKTGKCFLYQLKISLTNDYFSLPDGKIAVGSRIYGEPTHQVSGTADIHRKIVVPGYICIKLRTKDAINQIYDIDHRNSFVVIPDYTSNLDEYYYEYSETTNKYGKNIIKWNPAMTKIINLALVIDKNNISYEVFQENLINNPYADLVLKSK